MSLKVIVVGAGIAGSASAIGFARHGHHVVVYEREGIERVERGTAFLISESIWLRDEEPLTRCSFIGLAVRLAQMLGLNREPSFFPSLDSVVAETRRRLWWYLFYCDISVALAAGLPPLIDNTSWDVRPISELKDQHIGTAPARVYEEALASGTRNTISFQQRGTTQSLISTAGLYATGKYCDAVFWKELLLKLSLGRQMTRSDISDIRTELEQLRADLMARIRTIKLTSTSSDDEGSSTEESHMENAVLRKWTTVVLSGLCDKNWCFLYHPVVHTAISRVWASLRQSIFYHCKQFVEKCVCLAVEDRFRPFQWFWPGQHQPLHALMILVRELDQDPTIPLAEECRSVVDEAFALCGPAGGLTGVEEFGLLYNNLTEGGREAWDLLYDLRVQAWEKAGVDPNTLWSREQVTERAQARAAQLMAQIDRESHEAFSNQSTHSLEQTFWNEINQQIADESLAPEASPMLNAAWTEWDSRLGGQHSDWDGFFGFGAGSY